MFLATASMFAQTNPPSAGLPPAGQSMGNSVNPSAGRTVQAIEGSSLPNTTVYDTNTLWMGWTAILVPLLLLISYRIHRTNKIQRYHRQVANLERMWRLSIPSRES